MSLDDRIRARFADLEMSWQQVSKHGKSVDTGSAHQWCTSVLNLLSNAFGQCSVHYLNFKEKYGTAHYISTDLFEVLRGIFSAARDDYEGGYFLSVRSVISGELFGDFVVLAKQSLTEGHKDVAAVLACAALEDALKRYALSQDLDVQGKSMHEIVAALKSKGLVSGAQKTLLDTMPKIRDYAMHASWEKIKPEDVGGIIGFVEHFLLSNFS